jgi:hypothetical protein
MVSELEELKQRHDALEAVVRELEHRLTTDEQHLNSLILLGPPAAPDGDQDTDGEHPTQGDTWLRSVDSMLRSIGLHQSFHANDLKDVKGDLKILRTQQDGLYQLTMALTGGPPTALHEGVKRIERMITELAERGTS